PERRRPGGCRARRGWPGPRSGTSPSRGRSRAQEVHRGARHDLASCGCSRRGWGPSARLAWGLFVRSRSWYPLQILLSLRSRRNRLRPCTDPVGQFNRLAVAETFRLLAQGDHHLASVRRNGELRWWWHDHAGLDGRPIAHDALQASSDVPLKPLEGPHVLARFLDEFGEPLPVVEAPLVVFRVRPEDVPRIKPSATVGTAHRSLGLVEHPAPVVAGDLRAGQDLRTFRLRDEVPVICKRDDVDLFVLG